MSEIGFAEISAHNVESLSVSAALEPWSGVRILWDGPDFNAQDPDLGDDTLIVVKRGDQVGFFGDESGRVLEIKIAFGQSSTSEPSGMFNRNARLILEKIVGDAYSPFEAQNAILDPAFEIGDAVSLPDGALSMIYAMSGELDGLCAVDVSAPPDEAVNTAYPASWL